LIARVHGKFFYFNLNLFNNTFTDLRYQHQHFSHFFTVTIMIP
jgi:hypothetical protein